MLIVNAGRLAASSQAAILARPERRNVSLDTLRAAAIVLVLFSHATTNYGIPNALDVLGFGGVGVDLFFCLSGWLLGRQLCEEFRRTGTIDVRRFWLRRWMRTLPAYYAVLGLTLLQALVQGRLDHWWPYLVFLQNYAGMPFFGVSWSLCVEEYFYLLVAPLLMIVLGRPYRIVLAGLLILLPLFGRLAMPVLASKFGFEWTLEMTHLRYDQCAIGVVLAAISTFAPQVWSRLCGALFVLVPAAAAIVGVEVFRRVADIPAEHFDPLVWTFAFGALIVLANSTDFWRTQAVVPGARFLADRAYALYLLHIEAIAAMNHVFGVRDGYVQGPMWAYLAGVWVLSLVGAEVLYRVVEKPFMNAREWFGASRSLDHRPASAAPSTILDSMPRGSQDVSAASVHRM